MSQTSETPFTPVCSAAVLTPEDAETHGEGKAGITRQDIRVLVEAFYAAVREDERLGPIFHRHVGTTDEAWQRHLEKIESFWANVMLRDRAYQGNPMQAHLGVPEIVPGDFDRWLGLFEQTARAVLPPGKAALFDLLARRIGRSLAMGIERVHAKGGVPRFTV